MIFERQDRLSSPLTPDQLSEKIEAQTEHFPLPLEMGHERVGARFMLTLKHPQTELPFFGSIDNNQFTLSFLPNRKDFSSFQSIIEGKIEQSDEGSVVTLIQYPHDRAKHSIYMFDLIATAPIALFFITFFQKDYLSLPLYFLPVLSPFLILINHLVVGSLFSDERKKALKKLKKHFDLKSIQ